MACLDGHQKTQTKIVCARIVQPLFHGGNPFVPNAFSSDQHVDRGRESFCGVVPFPALGHHMAWKTWTRKLGGIPVFNFLLLVPGHHASEFFFISIVKTVCEPLLHMLVHIVHP